MQAYLDESGTHPDSPVMCVAGYLFTAPQARQFSKKWAKVRQREGIRYFRMADCAQGKGEFAGWSKERRLRVEKELIGHIRERMLFGSAVAMSVEEYNRRAPPGFIKAYGNAYTACLHFCLVPFIQYVNRSNYTGPIAYFFENGHSHQNEADKRFRFLAKSAARRREWRYTSHSFVTKETHPPCDAADFLAWHLRKHFQDSLSKPLRSPERRPMRADYMALLSGHIDAVPPRYHLQLASGEVLDAYFRSHPPPPSQ